MTKAEFVNLVNYFGENNILSIGFDNSAAITFGPNEFSLANNMIDELDSVRFIGFDARKNPFHIIKHIENIQSVVIRDSSVPMENYDRISIRG